MKPSTRLTIAASFVVLALFALGSLLGSPSAASAQRAKPKRPGGAPATGPASGVAVLHAPVGGAPQGELDAALFVVEPFFDVNARMQRPYAESRPLVEALAAKYPSDPRVQLKLGWLDERLGQFDAATKEMEQYAALAGRSPNALRRLAAYYRGREMAALEARTLDELASKLPPTERTPVYRRAIAAVNDGKPAGLSTDVFFDKLIDASPGDAEALKDYVSLLLEAKDSQRALAAIDRVARLSGEKSIDTMRLTMSERALVYDRLGQRQGALDVYERSFDPLWPRAVVADYYTLLSRYGVYRSKRRALQDEVSRGAASLAPVARLFNFYSYEGNLPAASRLLASYESSRKAAWTGPDLELVAGLYAQVGDFDESSRYLYSLYLMGSLSPGSPDRERVLSRLFDALINASNSATRLAPGGISLYGEIARIDPHPGALNGLLSLILAGNNPAAEFQLEQARAGGYLNRALAHSIYEQFAREYPQSPRLGRMTADLIDALADLGADKDVVAVGTGFMQKFPSSPEYDEVALGVADAYVRMKNRAAERQILLSLLDRSAARQPANRPLLDRNGSRWIYRPAPSPKDTTEEDVTDSPPEFFIAPNGTPVPADDAERFTESDEADSYTVFEPTGDSSESSGESASAPDDYMGKSEASRARPTYSQLLERTIASFEADKQNPAALAFFWGELKKHAKDEGLHERFLKWLGNTSLVNEELKAYKAALQQYDDNTWLHRFARWYVRRGRGAEVRRLTEQVVHTLDDEDVSAYLEQFAGYGGTPKGDALDWDKGIALQMARLAHARFPNNVGFVRTMLDLLAETKTWTEWERLSREYYFADAEIRANLLKRLSETNKLDQYYGSARERAANGLASGPSSAFAYAVFAADSARWLSHHDEALAAYRRLVELYPGERAYAEPLADLTRSFGERDEKLYLEAARVLDALAKVYPSDHRYATRAGEALAEAGDMAGAAQRWRSLVAIEPGSPATHLEAATVFWDYYQFDDAARELEALRASTHDPTVYAYRLGAIYDNKHDFARAIPEYVRTLGQDGDDRERAKLRLAEIARRSGVPAQIAAAYEAERTRAPEAWQLTLGYADFLKWTDRTGDAVSLLNREVDQRHDVVFLDEARDRFHQWNSPESEVHALRRVVDESRDERERIKGELQLASLLEEQGKRDEAVAVFDKLVADNPTNAGVLDEATRYYWRAGKRDKSVALSRQVIAKAQGDYRKRFVLDLARRQSDAGNLDDAEATLRAYFTESALDMDVFAALAKVLGDAKKQDALAALYSEALKRVREANLSEEDETARVADLRRGMIATLTNLGRFADAVDQHIEIVNRAAESEEALDAAYDYAARHDLAPRLVAYYEKLAKDSFKDYRWSLVLGRLYDLQGNTAGAAEAYRRAVADEPQRTDIRDFFAEALVRAGRDEDAVAELRRGWEIDGRNPEWLVRVARIRARQGKLDDAASTIDEAIAARSKVSTAKLFEYAGMLAEWGLLDKSTQLYERALDLARTDLEDADIDAEKLGQYVRVAVRVRPPAELFARLQSTKRFFDELAAKKDNYSAGRAKSIASAIDEAERNAFGAAAAEYGTQQSLSALDAALRSAAANASDRDERRRYLGIAQTANLSGAREAILVSLVDQALAAASEDKGAGFHSALGELADFYASRAQLARAAEQLAAYRPKDKLAGDYDYDRRIAEYYRYAGDSANEIAALERLYAATSGDARATEDERTAAVRRLFEQLVATNQRDRLVALAGTQSPYQLVLVNFLIERGNEDLARRAIASAKFSPAWVKAQTASIGLYFRDASPEVEASFRDVLRVKPIGELLGSKFDANTMLEGEDYYLVARNYGLWLDLVANKPDAARDYIVGRIEERPADGAAQAQLARFYLARNNAARATAHADLAFELAPDDRDVVAVRGEVLYAAGRQDEALAAWAKLVAGDERDADDYRLYFREMSRHGQLDRALRQLSDVIADRTYQGKFGLVKDLLGDISDYGTVHPEAWPAISDAIYGAAVDTQDDIEILLTALNDNLVPDERRGPYYRLLTDRLAAEAEAFAAKGGDTDGFELGDEYITPASELNKWRKKTADYLIKRGAFDEAAKLLSAIETEQTDARGRLRDTNDDSKDYSWIDLARATIELRAGRKDAAVAALERYCAADPGAADALPDRVRCMAAVDVLRAGGAEAEADAVLESVYRRLIDARQFDDANFTGLAQVLYRRGRTEEADGVLRRLASRSGDKPATLVEAAFAASSAGRYAMAIELREAAARVARADADNRLELARLRVASGDAAAGMAGFLDIVADSRASRFTRARAVDLAAEVAAQDAAARSTAANRLASGTSEQEQVLAALVAASGGDVDGARRRLQAVLSAGPSELAAIELGRLELGAHQMSPALAAFERALAEDPTTMFASSIAFGGAVPVDATIRLYVDAGRSETALKLAELHGKDYQNADEGGADGGQLVFEPTLAEVRGPAGLPGLGARNSAALDVYRADALDALAGAAARLERWGDAVAFARHRVAVIGAGAVDLAKAEARVGELQAAERDAARKLSGTLKLGDAVAGESVAIREFTLD